MERGGSYLSSSTKIKRIGGVISKILGEPLLSVDVVQKIVAALDNNLSLLLWLLVLE